MLHNSHDLSDIMKYSHFSHGSITALGKKHRNFKIKKPIKVADSNLVKCNLSWEIEKPEPFFNARTYQVHNKLAIGPFISAWFGRKTGQTVADKKAIESLRI